MKTETLEQSKIALPANFTTRGATFDDVEAAVKLFNRWSRAVIGRDEFTDVASTLAEWQAAGANPAEDVRLVFAPHGELVGYIEVWKNVKSLTHLELWGRVDPNYEELGIGTWMLHWAEQRTLQSLPSVPAELRFAPHVGTYHQAVKAKKLFEDMGYQHLRITYHMLIEMDAPVPAAKFPDGITLRTYNPETDADAVYRAENEAFRDHFGHVEEPFDQGLKRWKQSREHDGFDPTLYFLAVDGPSGEIAGVCLCRAHSPYDPDRGWMRSLGVRRTWRKRGIGLALLRHSFHEFYRRGKRKVGLGVDAQNLTGALRLYEGAGMHIDQAFDHYEKELRPGTEVSVQSIS